MKFRFKKIIFLLTICLTLFSVYGQDIHFTQFVNSPLNINPANAGLFFGNHRISIINRNQWRSVSVPFQTFSATFDTKLLLRPYHKDQLGMGFIFYRDKAGDSKFGTSQGSIAISYSKSIDKAARHLLSLAVEVGIAQRSIDYLNLTWDNQYNGYYYDPNISPSLQFEKDNIIFADIGAGISWYYFIKENMRFNSGISYFHLNRPDVSLFKEGNSLLDSRFNAYGNLEAGVSEVIRLAPVVLYMNQGNYNEFNYGMFIKLGFFKDISEEWDNYFNLGIFSRHNDALNVIAGLDYQKLSLGISYDINYSNLRKASYSRGGYEISLIYRIYKRGRVIKQLPACRTM